MDVIITPITENRMENWAGNEVYTEYVDELPEGLKYINILNSPRLHNGKCGGLGFGVQCSGFTAILIIVYGTLRLRPWLVQGRAP